jgi:RNA polymerase sigma-70 factor (ECF subfamily)
MLSERQRNLLRYQLIHALTLNQLAAMYGTHRATIARWLKGARRDVLEQVREDLRRRLGLSPSELDSVMKLIQSDVDASLVKTLLDSTSAG